MKKWFILGTIGGFLSSSLMILQVLGLLLLSIVVSAYFADICYSKKESRGKGYGPWFMALLGFFMGSWAWYFWREWK